MEQGSRSDINRIKSPENIANNLKKRLKEQRIGEKSSIFRP